MTDEALDKYARRVLLDALRAEWDDAGQGDTFAPSRKYQNDMRVLVAKPALWYKKKIEPPWRHYARRLSALAALIVVCVVAVWYLPNTSEAAAQASAAPLPTIITTLVIVGAVTLLIGKKRRK